jgi:hypothetical protein
MKEVPSEIWAGTICTTLLVPWLGATCTTLLVPWVGTICTTLFVPRSRTVPNNTTYFSLPILRDLTVVTVPPSQLRKYLAETSRIYRQARRDPNSTKMHQAGEVCDNSWHPLCTVGYPHAIQDLSQQQPDQDQRHRGDGTLQLMFVLQPMYVRQDNSGCSIYCPTRNGSQHGGGVGQTEPSHLPVPPSLHVDALRSLTLRPQGQDLWNIPNSSALI